MEGNRARLVCSSLTFLKGWSLPTARARATAGRASTVSNNRFKFGNGPSGSASSLRTREARSSQHQAEISAIVQVPPTMKIPPFEVVVQHLVVPFGFATIAVNRIVQTTGGGELKMHRLTRERTKAGGDEEQPGE